MASTAQSILSEQLQQVLATLPAREQKVIRMRFGLDDGYTHTLEEVGFVFKVTRERIRQIEAKALRRAESNSNEKIKGFSRSKWLIRRLSSCKSATVFRSCVISKKKIDR